MSIRKKIKAINNKNKQSKAVYDLDIQTVKIPALSSESISKYEFLTGKDVLLKKATTMKRFEYLLLSKELKVQTDIR